MRVTFGSFGGKSKVLPDLMPIGRMYHLLFEINIRGKARLAHNVLADQQIEDRYRGWRFDNETLRPSYHNPLVSMSDILDLPVGGARHENPARMAGDLVHSLYNQLIRTSADYIENAPRKRQLFDIAGNLQAVRTEIIDEVINSNQDLARAIDSEIVSDGWMRARRGDLEKIWDYETSLLAAFVTFSVTASQTASLQTLKAKCKPFETEVECDGNRLRMSRNLRIDARLVRYEAMFIDIKTGPTQKSHRIAIAGYAMAWESQENTPIDLGCIYYVRPTPKLPVPQIECDIFPILTTFRDAFIEKRNDTLTRKNENA